MFARRAVRRARSHHWAALLTIVLIVLGLGSQQAQADPVVRLTNDATGPLFAQGRLVPAQQSVACVRIGYRDTEPGASIGLYLQARGNLSSYLRIRIESGTGGKYGDCTGFAGRALYAGTLAELAGEHGSAQETLKTGRLEPRPGAVTYRLTLELADDNRAQGLSARASFTWVTTYVPSDAAVGAPARPRKGAHSSAAAAPTDRPQGSTSVDLRDGPPHSTEANTPSAITDITELAKQALFAIARGSMVSLLGLILVMIFLAVHSRLDRRDQKLADAPLTPTFLAFDQPYRPQGTS